MDTGTQLSQVRTIRERGEVAAGGETVRYEILTVDARTDQEVAQGDWPAGNVIVVVPGHGQTVAGPRHLVAELAAQSRSKIAWCIDPTPTAGGDCTEARAIAQIVRDRLSAPAGTTNPHAAQATIVGWSHGGSEALRAANEAPDLFPQYLGLCPTGLAERKPWELVASFLSEAARIVAGNLARGCWSAVGETLRVGADFARGLVVDLVRSGSIRCLRNDVCWACRKVPGPGFSYPGKVVLLFGTTDRVIRWRDVFPGCETADDGRTLAACVPAFRQASFPHSRQVEVRLVHGNHMGPEIHPARFVGPGLALLDQG